MFSESLADFADRADFYLIFRIFYTVFIFDCTGKDTEIFFLSDSQRLGNNHIFLVYNQLLTFLNCLQSKNSF